MELTNEIKKELHKRLKRHWRIGDFRIPPQIFDELCFCAEEYFGNLLSQRPIDVLMADAFVNGYCDCLENRAYITTDEKIYIIDAIFEVCGNLFNDKKNGDSALCTCLECEYRDSVQANGEHVKCKSCLYGTTEEENK